MTQNNSKYKDRFFKKLFSEKKDLLSLYNAINHTDYTDPEEIEINTIEDFIFMNMKNDLSFVVANVMNLYEQQSTLNPNMPLRGFWYLAELYRKEFFGHKDLYSSRMIPLPTPQFIVFYIGEKDEPDQKVMSMSAAYVGEPLYEPGIECTATLLNINYGHNQEMMEKCEKLKGYSILIGMVRNNISDGMTAEQAVYRAVDECIEEGILAEILKKHRAEATSMILEEYDEEFHIRNEKEISYEDGIQQGIDSMIANALHNGKTCESIAEFLGIPLERVREVEEKMDH